MAAAAGHDLEAPHHPDVARDVVDASFANDMLPVWLARRVGAQPTPDELATMVTEFLVAAFEAPGVHTA